MDRLKALVSAGIAALAAVVLSAFPVHFVHGFAGSPDANLELVKEALTYEFLCLLVIGYAPAVLAMRRLHHRPLLSKSPLGLIAAAVTLGGCLWFHRDLQAIHNQKFSDALAVGVNWLVIACAVMAAYVVFAPIAGTTSTPTDTDAAALQTNGHAPEGSRSASAIDFLIVPAVVLFVILAIVVIGFTAVLLNGLWQFRGVR